MATILYQFALSHYCEKARWALDYKGIPYHLHNFIPGTHMGKMKKLTGKTSVPVIVDDGKAIRNSADIIDYLDHKYPDKPLTPQDPNQKKEALELEEYFDMEIGKHLRRFFYYCILPDSKLAKSLLLRDTPSYGKIIYTLFPILRIMMRKHMNIYENPSKESERKLAVALDKVNQLIRNKEFLVGNQFTRADLTAASLIAPLCRPPEHDFDYPSDEKMPKALLMFRNEHQNEPFYPWVLKMYEKFRKI